MPVPKLLLMFGVVATILVASLLTPAGSDQSSEAEEIPVIRTPSCEHIDTPHPEKAWTVFVYCDADCNVVNTSDRYARRFQTRENVNVLMLEDPADAEAVLWRIDGTPENPVLTRLEEWGEVDMGDDTTMARFLAFGETWYPAEQTMVMIYSHGFAWRGASQDLTPSATEEIEPTWLTPMEMAEAFGTVSGIDAVLFTAPCIMSSMEAVYEVRDSVGLYVASEAVSSLYVWKGVFPLLLDALNGQNADLSSLGMDLPRWAYETYDRQYLLDVFPEASHPYIPAAALSSVPGGETLAALPDPVDDFALSLIEILDTHFEEIYQARTDAQSFGMNAVVDAYDFAERCLGLPGLEDAAQRVMSTVASAVQSCVADGMAHPQAHGLSLYFPMSYTDATDAEYYHQPGGFGTRNEEYLGYGLSLLEETHWDEFLVAFYEELLDRYDVPASEEADTETEAEAETESSSGH